MAAHPRLEDRSKSPLPRSALVAIGSLAAIGLVVLAVLLVRELMPHHATAIPKLAHDDVAIPVAPPPAAPVAPAPAPIAGHHAHDGDQPAAGPARAPAGDGLTRVRALASLITDPESAPVTGVFHNRQLGIDHYSYDKDFGPYRRGELKRDGKNPSVWEIDGSNGPATPTNVEDIAPKGALHEAAVVKDAQGNAVGTWFSVDSGPLAPAYVTQLATGGTRIISRAYLQTNRSDFPDALTAVLDR